MNLEEAASRQLKAEFPLLFDETRPISVRCVGIQRAEELLDRDNKTDAQAIAEMKRLLSVLRATVSCSEREPVMPIPLLSRVLSH